jgi:PQQ-like domain
MDRWRSGVAPTRPIKAEPRGVYAPGNSFRGTSGSDYATVAYDAATGAQRWASRYNGPANRDDLASSVAVSPGGATVFVTGTSGNNSAVDYATVAYNAATGAQLWASRYNGPANSGDLASSVAVSPGGATVFVTGTSRGARRWASRYNGPKNADDGAVSVAAGPGGRSVFVTGTSFAGTSGAPRSRITPRSPTTPPTLGCGPAATAGSPAKATLPRWRSARTGPKCSSPATSSLEYPTVAYKR